MGGSGIAKTFGGAETTDPKLLRLATDAATAVGVPPPRVFEVHAKEPNAFAASGLRGRDTAVSVTTGLREILSADELAAVLAHEMGHLRHRDVMRNVHIAAVTVGLGGIYKLGKCLMDAEMERARERTRNDEKEESSSVAPLAMSLMAGGLVLQGSAHLLRLAASRRSETKADLVAAEACGAQAIIDALKKIEAASAWRPADLREGAGNAYAFAMISDGSAYNFLHGANGLGRVLRTHPTLEQRVKALRTAAAEGSVPAVRP